MEPACAAPRGRLRVLHVTHLGQRAPARSAVAFPRRSLLRPITVRRGLPALLVCASSDANKGGPAGHNDGVLRASGELGASSGRKNNFLVRAVAMDAQPSGDDSSVKKGIASLLMAAWEKFVRPLRDFGFGRKSVWEGGVGLFILGGIGVSIHSRVGVFTLFLFNVVPD